MFFLAFICKLNQEPKKTRSKQNILGFIAAAICCKSIGSVYDLPIFTIKNQASMQVKMQSSNGSNRNGPFFVPLRCPPHRCPSMHSAHHTDGLGDEGQCGEGERRWRTLTFRKKTSCLMGSPGFLLMGNI